MPNRDRQSLEDMLCAARKVISYAKDTTRETLPTVPMRLDAVLYEIVVMGEAPAVFRKQSATLILKCLGGTLSA